MQSLSPQVSWILTFGPPACAPHQLGNSHPVHPQELRRMLGFQNPALQVCVLNPSAELSELVPPVIANLKFYLGILPQTLFLVDPRGSTT